MHTRGARLILFLFLLNAFTGIHAQIDEQFRLENITSEYIRIEHGLSQNSVNCILQDQRGFLWIGTWSGLNRFDGYNVKILTKDYYNPDKSLTNASVYGIVEDRQGYLWVATAKGLNRVDPVTFEIKKYTSANYAARGLANDTLSCIYLDKYGLIWLGTNQGAISLDPENEKFTHYQHNSRDSRTLTDRMVTCFTEDSTNLWIGTRNGLNCLIRESGEFLSYFGNKGPGHLSSSIITSLDFCQNGYLWIGTDNGLNRYNLNQNWFSSYYLIPENPGIGFSSQNVITSLHNDDGNDLWVGTQDLGLYIFNKETKEFKNLDNFTTDATIVNSNSILDIAEDRNGLYWVGTAHRGLVKLVPESNVFKPYLPGKATFGIEKDQNGLYWFGTQNGVYQYDREDEKIVKILEYEYDNPNSISGNRIRNLYRDGNDMWIATQDGLNKYNVVSGQIERFTSDGTNNTIAGDAVWGIMKSEGGDFWFATERGVSQYDPANKTFRNYRHDENNPNSISSNSCFQVFELEPDVFIISTSYGLNTYNALTDTWDVFLPQPGDLTSISSEYIFGVYQDSHGEIWIYTNGGGLNRFDPISGSFESFTELEGLADNITYGVIEDNLGNLWISTNNGLSRFDPVEERFVNYDVQDGLLSNEFNVNGFFKSEDGEIFAAGVNGISSFFPPTATSDPERLLVQFTELIVHAEGSGIEIPLQSEIRLTYNQNTFHVSFAALDFLNPFKNRFQYKLKNYDDRYTTLDVGVHTVDYRKLPPGEYELHIIGSNSQGVSAENTLPIRIIAAWWQTLTFKILAISIVVLLILLIIALRYNAIKNKHQMEKQLLSIQTELVQSQKFALRSQMNPHFIFNSLNSIQNFVLKNDVDSANYYLSNFSVLMRRVLEYSQHNLITLDEEIQLIELYIKMEKLRFSNKFDIIIDVDPKIDVHLVKIPPMLLQPYLENAILHGLQLIKHRGVLTVRFKDKITAMDIEIEDNGIGREKANIIRAKQDHKSKGLKNIEKRIQLYNKINPTPIEVSITDLSKENIASGTLVKLRIPYELDEPDS